MFVDNGQNITPGKNPERILGDKLFIPDISFLTKCTLPSLIDLKQKEGVLDLLNNLINEEKKRNPKYRGMIIFGSIAHNTSNNGSDIDLVHVIKSEGLDHRAYELAWPIEYRLQGILDICFAVPTQCEHYPLDISGQPFEIQQTSEHLDKFSIPLGLNHEELEKINAITNFDKKDPFTGPRKFKTPSQDTSPHYFHFPSNGIFPWYVEYGLLEKLKDNNTSFLISPIQQ